MSAAIQWHIEQTKSSRSFFSNRSGLCAKDTLLNDNFTVSLHCWHRQTIAAIFETQEISRYLPEISHLWLHTVTREKTIIRCATPEQNVFSSFGYSFRGTEWQIGAWRTMLGWFLCNDRRTHHRRAENEVGKASVLNYFEYFFRDFRS